MIAVVAEFKVALSGAGNFRALAEQHAHRCLEREPGCQQFDITQDPGTGALTATDGFSCGTFTLRGNLIQMAACSTTPASAAVDVHGTVFEFTAGGGTVFEVRLPKGP